MSKPARSLDHGCSMQPRSGRSSPIRIITIEREYGAGAAVIAEQVAGRLGWKLWDQLLTCEIARLSQAERSEVESREERVDPLYYRLLKSIMRGSFEGSANVHRLNLLDADTILRITKQVTLDAAAAGKCVIVGRGSQHFLCNRDDTMHIFLFAPKTDKIRRLVADGVGEAEAEELVETVDQDRAEFIEKYFHMEWPNRPLYHAMLNTAVGEEIIVESILGLKRTLDNG